MLFLCFRTEVDMGACSTWNVWSASPVKSAVCSWSPQTPPSPSLSLCPCRPVCQNNKEAFNVLLNSLQHLFIHSNCPWILCFNLIIKRFLKDNCQVSQIFQQNWTMLRLTLKGFHNPKPLNKRISKLMYLLWIAKMQSNWNYLKIKIQHIIQIKYFFILFLFICKLIYMILRVCVCVCIYIYIYIYII